MDTPSRWRELYRAALFEMDDAGTLARIETAEKAIADRARALFLSRADHGEEMFSLDSARYALCALRTCVELKTSSAGGAVRSGG